MLYHQLRLTSSHKAKERESIISKLKVFEAFAGVGSQRMALRNIGIPFEVVGICEWDKNAIKAYQAIHSDKVSSLGYAENLSEEQIDSSLLKVGISGDGKSPSTLKQIQKWNLKEKQDLVNSILEHKNFVSIMNVSPSKIPDHDLFTYSFPCQDISVAGKQEGLTKGSGTRSGLLWECEKIIKEKKPRFLLMENVKNLVSKRHKPDFDIWCEWLEEQGYTNYWEIINAKDQGVPQNRERIFMVSILGEHRPFSFPESKILDIRLKDILQDKVDEKFYISEEKTKQLLVNNNGDIDLSKQVVGTCHERNDLAFATRDRVYNPNKVSPTLTATMYKDAPKIIQVGNIVESDGGWSNPQRGRIYSSEGLSPSLNTVGGGGQEPKIVVENTPPDLIKVGRIGKEGNVHDGNLVYSSEGISPTLLARDYKGPVKIVDRPKVLIKNATKQGYLEAGEGDSIDISYPNSKTKRGRVQEGVSHTLQTMDLVGTIEFGEVFVKGKAVEPPLIGASRGRYNEDNEIEQQLELNGDGVSNTLTTVQKDNYVVDRSFRIRKLTPLECWRLMSFTDEDFYKAESVSSNSQLYKQAGNSIVTKILEGIFAAIYSISLD